MKIYAILDKETNTVLNLINVENENFIFTKENEYAVLANRVVDIGMTYDKTAEKFLEVGDKLELLDLRDEIQLLVSNHQILINENSLFLSSDQLKLHTNYINQLRSISILESYSEMKLQFDSIETPPEFPPKPKEITQDVFKSVLNLTEKILWNNPETGTTQQSAVINTLKMEFPYYGVENMTEELNLLEQVGFFTSTRITEVTQALS
jgi:hypothetical protein